MSNCVFCDLDLSSVPPETNAFPHMAGICANHRCPDATKKLRAINDVMGELTRATTLHAPFINAHEGWAVIAEEFDELWDEIKVNPKHRDKVKMRTEAVQLTAMVLRFLVDVCD